MTQNKELMLKKELARAKQFQKKVQKYLSDYVCKDNVSTGDTLNKIDKLNINYIRGKKL